MVGLGCGAGAPAEPAQVAQRDPATAAPLAAEALADEPAAAEPAAAELATAEIEVPAWPLPYEIVSPWEFALIVMDPHDLTATQRRQRAYARRKAVMLNPDSVTARVLEDLAKATANGDIDPRGGSQIVFTARGVEGKGPPPAGWRPPAGASAPGAGDSEAAADASAPGADGSR